MFSQTRTIFHVEASILDQVHINEVGLKSNFQLTNDEEFIYGIESVQDDIYIRKYF